MTKLSALLSPLHPPFDPEVAKAPLTEAEVIKALPKSPTYTQLRAVAELLGRPDRGGLVFEPRAERFLAQVYLRGLTALQPDLQMTPGSEARLGQSLALWHRWAKGHFDFRPIKSLSQALPKGAVPVRIPLPSFPFLRTTERYRYFLVSHEGIKNGLDPWNEFDPLRGKKRPMVGLPAAATLVRVGADGSLAATPFAMLPDQEVQEHQQAAPRRPAFPRPPKLALEAIRTLTRNPGLYERFASLAKEAIAASYPSGSPERHQVFLDRVLARAELELLDAEADVAGGLALRFRASRDHQFNGERYWIRDVVVQWSATGVTARVLRREDWGLIDRLWHKTLAHPEMLNA
ncbi:MAG: hypothetical protein IPG45_34070 [Deltaproteobacteria bacterium]|nr:hypothetical protein [Deltaproteobacteria bacterium]